LLKDEVVAALGLVMANKLTFCAVTCPAGNVRIMTFSVALASNAVEVVKVTVAVPVVLTALLKVKAFNSARTDPTAGELI